MPPPRKTAIGERGMADEQLAKVPSFSSEEESIMRATRYLPRDERWKAIAQLDQENEATEATL